MNQKIEEIDSRRNTASFVGIGALCWAVLGCVFSLQLQFAVLLPYLSQLDHRNCSLLLLFCCIRCNYSQRSSLVIA